MARKTQSHVQLRRETEAADKHAAAGEKGLKKGKREKEPGKKPSRAKKPKVAERRRLMWAVFNGSMKEEGRFPYDRRDAAEEKVQQLKLKAPKKLYFIQTIKETIAPAAKIAEEAAATK